MLMKFEECGVVIGWHEASEIEAIEMKKNGWVESSEEERSKLIEAKKRKINNKEPESVTIAPQREAVKGKPGRKPKNFGVNSYGNSPDTRKS